MDSLYLSFQGELSSVVDDRLRALKAAAQSKWRHEQAFAQLAAGGHFFEVRDKGAGLFPYVLEDGAYRIQLARTTGRLPLAYVRVSSDYLAHHEPVEAESELAEILSEFGKVESQADVSRVDLYVDFLTDADLEAPGRRAWVTRAEAINAYSVGGHFSGWMIGAGGALSCRLYDKTLEIQSSRKDYLKKLWARRGWVEGQTVWRLEFQFRREVLTQKGLSSLHSVLGALAGLWSYATTEWLRLTVPSDSDATRSRWLTHPTWVDLASVDWGMACEPLRERFAGNREPSDEMLCRIAFGALTSFMAKRGLWNFGDAWNLLGDRVDSHYARDAEREGVHPDKFLEERVRFKGRKFNTILNADETWERDRIRREVDAYADEYRKRSRGGRE